MTTKREMWISTKERLPQENRIVLGLWLDKDGSVAVDGISLVTFQARDYWHNPEDDEDDYVCPTYWMPIPPIPTTSAT